MWPPRRGSRGPRPTHGYRAEGEGGRPTLQSAAYDPVPHRTARELEARVCDLRQARKLGPACIGSIVELPAATVHRILTRHGLNRLAWLARPTGEPVRRYQRSRPGRRTVGRAAGDRNRQATTTARRSGTPVIGYSYVHSAVDDHSCPSPAPVPSVPPPPIPAVPHHRRSPHPSRHHPPSRPPAPLSIDAGVRVSASSARSSLSVATDQRSASARTNDTTASGSGARPPSNRSASRSSTG